MIEAILWYFFGFVYSFHDTSILITNSLHSVESQGRTLEQLEWVYNQKSPVKASLQVDKVIIQADGKVTEKVDTSN